MKDPRLVRYMKRLAEAWSAGDCEEFLSVLDDIRGDEKLTPRQKRAVAKTVAQQQSALYMSILSDGGPIHIPEGAGWAQGRTDA